MASTLAPSAIKLSICITTFNRAAFIGATLESILVQATPECEVVVLDGGSTDGSERVVSEYMHRFENFRYVRQDANNGFDRDCNRAVELARGEYCWLMTDDDHLKPGALAIILEALHRDISLAILNVETRDFTMSKVLQSRWIELQTDCTYAPGEMDQLFIAVGHALIYVGCIVIKREIWLAREKEPYYGSLFSYLGVIFQARLPAEALVLAEPAISYRAGNSHAFSSKMFETFMINLPSLVWSLPLSESAKRAIYDAQPWRSFQELTFYRGLGAYSLTEYRRWIRPQVHSTREAFVPILVGLLPGILVNAFAVVYYSLSRRRYRGVWQPEGVLQALRESPFYVRNWRVGGHHA